MYLHALIATLPYSIESTHSLWKLTLPQKKKNKKMENRSNNNKKSERARELY